jgi:serine/threonine-protein kinase
VTVSRTRSLVANDTSLGAALPGYDIGEELGRGAFGVVIAGRHRQLGRDVAIKQLSPGLVNNDLVRARFRAEAQVLASIDHPHIVPVYDYVEQGDRCALVMERLAGGTVWRRFVDQGFDQRTACAVALLACSGLEGAHHRGILHRDMKPENMLFGEDRVLKVTDFGIARMLGDDDTLATRDGELLGTPAYMAPEQASGADLGPATDVYAAGVMLYELLSGRLPYREEGGSLAIVLRHVNEEPTPLSEVAPLVPARLVDVVMQSLARDPADRFATAEGFGVAIGEAAGASWGPTWMDGLSVMLREPGPILDSVHRASAVAAPATVVGQREMVRPVIQLHSSGAAATGIEIQDLMPLRQVPVDIPPFPTVLAWVGAALVAIAIVLGLLGIGSSHLAPTLKAGSVTVAGHDPASGGRVSINLDNPIPVVVHALPERDGVPTSARLVLSVGGLAVVHSTTVPLVSGPGGLQASVDASAGRYVVGGKLSADLELTGPQGTVNDDFVAQANRTPLATFGGVLGIVLLLVVAAYAESLLRVVRRGRRRDGRSAVVGLVIVGAATGLTAALWGWLIGVDTPTLVGWIIPTVVGAVAGVVVGLAALEVGRRARALRQSKRLVLVARRRTMPTAEPTTTGAG